MLGETTPEKNACFELRDWDTVLGLKLAIAQECRENIDHRDLIIYEKTSDNHLPLRELDDTMAFFNGVAGGDVLYLRHVVKKSSCPSFVF